MEEIKLGTVEDMHETLKKHMRKKWQWAEQWLGAHYIVTGIAFGMFSYYITYPKYTPPDEFFVILILIYIASAWHWMKTRKPELLRDEHGRYTFTYKPIHGKRAVFNVKQRAKDIISNSKIPVITLIKGNKVRIEQNGQKSTRTAEQFGMTGKNGQPVYNWTMAKKFALNKGYYDFKDDVNWTIQKERAKVRKRLEVFRKQLSISLGLPDFELGDDYTYYKGVFEWKSIVWRDTSIPQSLKEEVTKMDNVMRKNVAGSYVKASLPKVDMTETDWFEHHE